MSRRTNYHYDGIEEDDDEDEHVTALHNKVKILKDVSDFDVDQSIVAKSTS